MTTCLSSAFARPTLRVWIAVFWVLGAIVALPGCGGCEKDPLAAKKEEEEKKKKKKKDKDRDLPNFEMAKLVTNPDDPDETQNHVKPGHWVTLSQMARANNFDFRAELELAAVDKDGNRFDVDRTPYQIASSRPAVLVKGQKRTFEMTSYVPAATRNDQAGGNRKKVWFQSRLLSGQGGTPLETRLEGTQEMAEYECFLLVLARDSRNYLFLKTVDSARLPTNDFDTQYLSHYRVIIPKVDERVPLPENSLTWTSIAHLVWDKVNPKLLSPDQQQALLDWIHWGGNLIISSPESLDLLKGSFLEPYLAATGDEAYDLDAAAVEELNANWSLAGRNKDPRRLEILAGQPMLAVKLKKHESAADVTGTGGLVVERRVGNGRIVQSAFSLDDRYLLHWKSYDGFLNGALLRRPARDFSPLARLDSTDTKPFWKLPIMGAKRSDGTPLPPLTLATTNPMLTSTVRYFSRDIGYRNRTVEEEVRRQLDDAMRMNSPARGQPGRGVVPPRMVPPGAIPPGAMPPGGVVVPPTPPVPTQPSTPPPTPESPGESKSDAEAKPGDGAKSGDDSQPSAADKPTEDAKPSDGAKPKDEAKSGDELKPSESGAEAATPNSAGASEAKPAARQTESGPPASPPTPPPTASPTAPSAGVAATSSDGSNGDATTATGGGATTTTAQGEESTSPADVVVDYRLESKDWRFGGYSAASMSGVAGWNDFSGAAHDVRLAMQEAAGIKIPSAQFVLKMIGIYLVVLVPLNWLVFRLLGKVEWAWVATPLIAIVGTVLVIQQAQLDIGFLRSRRELAILETHGNYSRGHLSRYSLLYTYLGTGYDVALADPNTLAQPFSKNTTYVRGTYEGARLVQYRRDGDLRLDNFFVPSYSSEMVHTEQMFDLGGALRLDGDDPSDFEIVNASTMPLHGAAVLYCPPNETVGQVQLAWVGDLRPGVTLPLRFGAVRPQESLRVEQWDESPVTTTKKQSVEGEIRLTGLMALATKKLLLFPGDARLVAWTGDELPGVEFAPTAAQTSTRTMLLAHLRRGALPPAVRDENVRTDYHDPKQVDEPPSEPQRPGSRGTKPSGATKPTPPAPTGTTTKPVTPGGAAPPQPSAPDAPKTPADTSAVPPAEKPSAP